MQGKVIFEITAGVQTGQKYEYDQPERIFVGRQEDCGIVLPINTVSRYHCLLSINPPNVKLQDFGSLNGTYINDRKIGQRDRDLSVEEARTAEHEIYELHDGDRIRLGKSCEIKCSIEVPEIRSIPLSEELGDPDGTVPEEQADPDGTVPEPEELFAPDESQPDIPVPKPQQQKPEAPKPEPPKPQPPKPEPPKPQPLKPEPPKPQPPKPEPPKPEPPKPQPPVPEGKLRKCTACGKSFTPTAEDNNLCPDCLRDQAKLLDDILAVLLGDAEEKKAEKKEKKKEEKLEPSLVEGFDKVARLGKGGMGEVWKVKERKTGKYYALKTMLPQVAADEKGKRQFLREAMICEQLRHKNVIRTYQTGCRNDVFYILMDLCEGGSAEDLMQRKGGKLSLNMATWIILQALDGLDYVHNVDVTAEIRKRKLFSNETKEVEVKGLVHRDFKPGNIFLSDRSDHPTAIVADFGMAKAFETAGLTDMTSVGQAAGTVPFMPRQQVMNYRYAKPEVDVWAAAASYYSMLTGCFPKNLKPGNAMWQSLLTEKAVPIRRRNPAVPAQIAEVIDRALVDNPEIGCKTAASFRKQLVAALPAETRDYCKSLLKK